MPLFGAEAPAFFRELAENNTREFFHAHRALYDAAIREPLERLTEVAEGRYGAGHVMRPNRDIRFSKDKSPYRTSAGMSASGVYLSVSAEGIDAGGGVYGPTREQLDRARRAIDGVPRVAAELRDLVDGLVAQGFEFAGPELATAPRGYARDHPRIELLRMTHYAALRKLPGDSGLPEVQAVWAQIEPLIEWTGRVIGPRGD